MTVRAATAANIPAVSALYTQFYRFHARLQPERYREAHESGRYPLDVINGERGDLLVAGDGARILGFLHVREAQTPPYAAFHPCRYAEVVDLMVDPACRRQGVATRLLDAAEAWAARRGLSCLELSVLEENEGAARLYAARGYRPVSHTLRKSVNPVKR